MTEAAIAPVRALPLAELPAAALRIAAGFASRSVEGLAAVQIGPGLDDGTVMVRAAAPTRAVEITAQGACARRLALPTAALRAALKLDRAAEHVAIVREAGELVSLRTFSPVCTVGVSMPVAHGVQPLRFPPVEPGPCEVGFDAALLRATLADLAPLSTLTIEPYARGLQITGEAEGVSVFALLAGVAKVGADE
jgi:hypothetical protein